MARLLVHVEGQTEEKFVTDLLRKHLLDHGYERVDPKLLGDIHQRSRRGGIRPWLDVRKDIIRHLKEDRRCISTTMVDYYGLPPYVTGPGPVEHVRLPWHSGKEQTLLKTRFLKTFAPEWAEVSIPPALYLLSLCTSSRVCCSATARHLLAACGAPMSRQRSRQFEISLLLQRKLTIQLQQPPRNDSSNLFLVTKNPYWAFGRLLKSDCRRLPRNVLIFEAG